MNCRSFLEISLHHFGECSKSPRLISDSSTDSICPQSTGAAWQIAREITQSAYLSGQCGFQAAATFLPGTAQGWNYPRAASRWLHTAQDQQGQWLEWYCQILLSSPRRPCIRCETRLAFPHCRILPAGLEVEAGQCIDGTA